MDQADLRRCRSLLFLPASNSRAIGKARTLEADMVVLDLEDSVADDDKAAAREAAVAATIEGFGARLVAIRVNATDSPWFGDDIVAVRHARPDFIVLAKVESPAQVHDAVRLMARPVLAMIETARGVMDAGAIARGAAALVAGTNDLAASLGLPPAADRTGMVYALQRVVLAARAAGIAAFDGVHNGLDGGEGLAAECAQGRAWGFDGKSLIHPSQIETANRAFSPNEEEVAAARRLIEAWSGGAQRHEGRMIERLHVDQARAVLAKANRLPA